MKISFLIVTRNRPDALALTLDKLRHLIDPAHNEVRVFIDGCQKTNELKAHYEWVHWDGAEQNMGPSRARHRLYAAALGEFLVGLDDDAHPVSKNFLKGVEARFRESDNTVILAFQELRGLFESDMAAIEKSRTGSNYKTNDFVGSGFAIRKVVYEMTEGFPVWMDIYGEETAVALQVLDLGYDILYTYELMVNHRIDIEARKMQRHNYFRFEHQLQNSIRFYLVLHPHPIPKIAKLLVHNFKKYALSNWNYFRSFFKVVLAVPFHLRSILSHRKPVSQGTITKSHQLTPIKYN